MGFDNKANIDKIKQGLETTRNINPDRYNKLKKIYEDCAAAGSNFLLIYLIIHYIDKIRLVRKVIKVLCKFGRSNFKGYKKYIQ